MFFDITVKIVDEKVGNSLPNYANSACYLANLSAFEQEEEVLCPSGSIFLISKKQWNENVQEGSYFEIQMET